MSMNVINDTSIINVINKFLNYFLGDTKGKYKFYYKDHAN